MKRFFESTAYPGLWMNRYGVVFAPRALTDFFCVRCSLNREKPPFDTIGHNSWAAVTNFNAKGLVLRQSCEQFNGLHDS